MGCSLTSVSRDMGRKVSQRCLLHPGLPTLEGDPPTEPTTAFPNIQGIWHNRDASPNMSGAGLCLGPGPPWSLSKAGARGRTWGKGRVCECPPHPPSLGTPGGPCCALVPWGLSPGLLMGLCGMGGRSPLGRPGLLENRRGVTAAVARMGWEPARFFHLVFPSGLHGLEAVPDQGGARLCPPGYAASPPCFQRPPCSLLLCTLGPAGLCLLRLPGIFHPSSPPSNISRLAPSISQHQTPHSATPSACRGAPASPRNQNEPSGAQGHPVSSEGSQLPCRTAPCRAWGRHGEGGERGFVSTRRQAGSGWGWGPRGGGALWILGSGCSTPFLHSLG